MLCPVLTTTPAILPCEKLALIPITSSAEVTNEAASKMNAVSRPNSPATQPPRAAPTASIVPQEAEVSVLAAARSSGATRLGRLAPDAGRKKALSAVRLVERDGKALGQVLKDDGTDRSVEAFEEGGYTQDDQKQAQVRRAPGGS